MQEKEYYQEIENYIKKNEINKKARILEENYDTLNNYWEIGRILVEAQGGKTRAKYGNELIKKWSIEFTKTYGKGYDYTNLKRFRQFYSIFQKGGTLCHQLTWSHIRYILPIKDESERNYYINLCIEKNISVRELRKEDKAQIEFYMELIDKQIKEPLHNRTIGIIITKEQDKLIANFIRNENIIPLTYKLENK